jgi:O-succinylbenzoic acid--CoA ligase
MMPDWLRRRAALTPNRLALRAGTERLSFGDLDRRVDAVAAALSGHGVRDGTRVALLLGNGIVFAVVLHALARVRAVAVPLNTRLAAPELAWQAQDCRAAVLVHDAGLAASAAVAAPRIPQLEIGRLKAAAAGAAQTAPGGQIDLTAVQGIVYTSATTGRPKGVMLTYGNHWWSAIGSALHLGVESGDCWLAALPLYHVGGMAILWRSVIYGTAVAIHERFDAGAADREIESGDVTLVSVVSTMLREMLDARDRPYASRLRCALLGGGPAPVDLTERAARVGLPVAPTYGLTEAASQVTTLLPDEAGAKPGSSGKPLFPTDVTIDAPAGEIGEILVRGPTVMAGYADRPDDTARALHDGWLHTGDLGRVDRDGYLYVVDRRDDLIVTGGENVYPAEVERVLLLHPAVADAGVVGLPDARWGQSVVAAVKLSSGSACGEDDLRTFCAGRLASYKIPRRIGFVDDVPRTGAKVLRGALRRWAEERWGA